MIAARRRAALVAPGSDERKARKALESAADEVVLDLEDAVTPARKDEARDLVARLVREYGATRAVSVRVNGPGTEWFRADLAAAAEVSGELASIVIPKVESVADLDAADRLLRGAEGVPLRVQALVETPTGVQNVVAIAAGPRVVAVIIGYADLGAALGRSTSVRPAQWLYVQDRVLHAARAAGVDAIDGPFLGIKDDEAFRDATRWVADLGFDGKWVIHPAQIDTAQETFTPTAEQADQAEKVLAALEEAETLGAGAAQLDGQMLDEAVAVAARRTLAKIGA
ncbi:HpcH/HpaI aldolase/citrate lyase family protein [Rhodococcus sp. NPDC003318]|uniref:HpcH/HpaI aldolase/citrate lyase family protein n=1 Tax=Rhodococcus sp. NPDC003318 TaxID=3364503 RepID=UPI003694DC9C